MVDEKEWYSSQEAAEFLKIPMHRLARLRREGRIKGVVGGGKNPRYAMYHINELQKTNISDLRLKPKSTDEKPTEETRNISSD